MSQLKNYILNLYRDIDFETKKENIEVSDKIKKYIGDFTDYISTFSDYANNPTPVSYIDFLNGDGDVDFCVYTPSPNSFIIFGGLYDTETGYLCINPYKNRLNIPAVDLVSVVESLTRVPIELDVLNIILSKYKLTGNSTELEENLISHNHLQSTKNYSIVKKNISPIHIISNEDIHGTSAYESLYKKLNDLSRIIVELGTVYDYLIQITYKGKINYTNKSLIYNEDIFDEKYITNLYNYTSISFTRKVLKKDKFEDSFFNNQFDFRVSNLLDMLPDYDIVYSSDTEKMLKYYHIDTFLNKRRFNDLVASIDNYNDRNNPIRDITSIKSINKKKYTDNEAENPFTMASILLDIKVINRMIRKI